MLAYSRVTRQGGESLRVLREEAVCSLKGKSPGVGNIPPELLKGQQQQF